MSQKPSTFERVIAEAFLRWPRKLQKAQIKKWVREDWFCKRRGHHFSGLFPDRSCLRCGAKATKTGRKSLTTPKIYDNVQGR